VHSVVSVAANSSSKRWNGRSNKGDGLLAAKGAKKQGPQFQRGSSAGLPSLQASAKDYVEQERYEKGEESSPESRGRRGVKEYNWRRERETAGRRVQVVTNNGLVDLEEQLGLPRRIRDGRSRLRISNVLQGDEGGYIACECSEADADAILELERKIAGDSKQLTDLQHDEIQLLMDFREASTDAELRNSSATIFVDSPAASPRNSGPVTYSPDQVNAAEEVDKEMKMEQELQVERVKDFENDKNAPSSSTFEGGNRRVRSHIRSLKKPAIPGKVTQEKLSAGVKVVEEGFFGSPTSPSSDNEKGGVYCIDGVKPVIDEEFANIRNQIASGDLIAARSSLLMLSKEYPYDPSVMVHFAQLKRKEDDLVGAASYYGKAIQLFKDQGVHNLAYVRTLLASGSLEVRAGNVAKARSLFTESVEAAAKEQENGEMELKGAVVYGLHAWAMLEQKLGNWSKARELLERAANVQPGNAVVHQTRALLEARAHNYAAARFHFRLAVEAAPEDVKCWQAWALFEARQSKPTRMRQLFQRALQAEPNNLHSLQAWAHQEALIGTEESRTHARKLYQKCVELDSNSVHSWQAWAVLEQKAGNFTGARILFERGLGANPQSVPCLQAYAHMERMGGNFEAAKTILEAAISVESRNPATLMEMGLVEQALGNEEIAAEWFKQAAISDKQKSRIKRRMFESRKAASKWKKPNSNKSALTTASAVPQYQGSPKLQFHEQFPESKESTKRPF